MPISWVILNSADIPNKATSRISSQSSFVAGRTQNEEFFSSVIGRTDVTSLTAQDASSRFTSLNETETVSRTEDVRLAGSTIGGNTVAGVTAFRSETTAFSRSDFATSRSASSLNFTGQSFYSSATLTSSASFTEGATDTSFLATANGSEVQSFSGSTFSSFSRETVVSFGSTGRTTFLYSTTESSFTFSSLQQGGQSSSFLPGTTSVTTSASNSYTDNSQTSSSGITTSSSSLSLASNNVETFTTSTQTTGTTAVVSATSSESYSTSYAVGVTTTLSRLTSVTSNAGVTRTAFATTTALSGQSFGTATVFEATANEVLFPIFSSSAGSGFLTSPSTRFTSTLRTLGQTAIQSSLQTVSSVSVQFTSTSAALGLLTSFFSGTDRVFTSTAGTLSWTSTGVSTVTTTGSVSRSTSSLFFTFPSSFSSSALFQSGTATSTGSVFFTAPVQSSVSQWDTFGATRTANESSSTSSSSTSSSAGSITADTVDTGSFGATASSESFQTVSRFFTDYPVPSITRSELAANVRAMSQFPSFFTTTNTDGATFQSSRIAVTSHVATSSEFTSFGGLNAASQSLLAFLFLDGRVRLTRVSSSTSTSSVAASVAQTENISGVEFAIEKPSVILAAQDALLSTAPSIFFSPRTFKSYD